MILRKLALRNFRRFASFEADFGPGLNVIFGNNEEGKSTLRQAIALALYEQPATTKTDVLSLKRWSAVEQFGIALEFEADGRSYVLSKDLQTRTARLEEWRLDVSRKGAKNANVAEADRRDEAAQVWQDARTIDRRIKELLGLPTAKLFESTVHITQRDITSIQDGKTIADQLQELATGGEQDVLASKVIAELDKASKALVTRARDNPGPLAALPEQIRMTEVELAAKRRALEVGNASREKLIAKRQQIAAEQRELADSEQIERACRERIALEEKLVRSRAEEERLDDRIEKIRKLQSSIDRAEDELASYAAVLAISAEGAVEIKALEMQVEGSKEASPITDIVTGRRAKARAGIMVAGSVAALVGLVTSFFYQPLFALLLLGIALIIWEIARARSSQLDPMALEAVRRTELTRRHVNEMAAQLEVALAQAGCESTAEFYRLRAEGEDLQRRLGNERSEIAGLLAGQTLAALEGQRKAASREVRDCREHLEEPRIALAQMDQLGYQRLVDQIARLKTSIEALASGIHTLEVAAAVNQIGIDEIYCLEENLDDLQKRLEDARERQEVLDLARTVIEEARAATMVTASDMLESEIGGLVAEITNGRYGEVKIDGNRLGLQLLSPERGEAVDVALDRELSTGTVEQIYLAARLAITKLLTGQRRPPFIFDDPFVTFDSPRTRAVLSLCKRLSAEQQILLFTCDERYLEWADNVVRLPIL